MQILQALIEANEPEAIPLLMDCLASDDQDIVLFAASAIGDTATKMKDICNIAVAELVEALSSDNPQVRKCILTTLMLLDVPFCYSDAITNVMMVDNQPYNQALAKKIIQNIGNNDFSEFDYGSCSSSTFKECTLIQNKDYITSSESAEPQKQVNEDMIENLQAKQNINLVSGENIIDEGIEQDVEILPLLCNTDASDTSDTSENTESLLLALKVAMNPENLISDDLWFDWSLQLESHPIASQLIFDVANEIGLPWVSTRKYESFDQYLGFPLQRIFKKLGWNNNRTLLICVANAVLGKMPKLEPANVINDKKPKTVEPIKKVGKITFDELYSSDNSINLISNEIWDEWTNLIINHAARNLYISGMVDELGSLFWQARWKSERLSDYCLYSFDDIKNIPIMGKNKTIIICMAKVAIDALSKIELSANDDNDKLCNMKKT